MQKLSIEQAVEQIVQKDSRYHPDAYQFVRDALGYTIKAQKKVNGGKERHVSGKELLEGVRLFALEQFGPLAFTVLKYWNLCKSEDVGEIVFNMVSMNILKTTETDSREDFKEGYNFEEAFRRPFEPSGIPPVLKTQASRNSKLGSAKPL